MQIQKPSAESIILTITLFVALILALELFRVGNNLYDLKERIVYLERTIAPQNNANNVLLKIKILKPSIELALAKEIVIATLKYSKEYSRDPDLILAIIKIESDFQVDAISEAGAVGLMQVMPKSKVAFELDGDLFDISDSIKNGLRILAFYEQLYGDDLDMALVAYNRGPAAIEYSLRNNLNPKNGYGKKVREVVKNLKKLSM